MEAFKCETCQFCQSQLWTGPHHFNFDPFCMIETKNSRAGAPRRIELVVPPASFQTHCLLSNLKECESMCSMWPLCLCMQSCYNVAKSNSLLYDLHPWFVVLFQCTRVVHQCSASSEWLKKVTWSCTKPTALDHVQVQMWNGQRELNQGI